MRLAARSLRPLRAAANRRVVMTALARSTLRARTTAMAAAVARARRAPSVAAARALSTAAAAATGAGASGPPAPGNGDGKSAATATAAATAEAAAAAAADGSDDDGSSAGDAQTALTDVKDPELIFQSVWKNLIAKYGEHRLVFPKELMFLAGAPGAGKGVATPYIMLHRGFTAKPIEVSALLRSPEAERIKAAGHLVGDKQVLELLLEQLLEPRYRSGVIVDGFPRTPVQAECIHLLYRAMMALRNKFALTQHDGEFRRPIFHALVLFIDEHESVRRQLHRGKQDIHHNAMVEQTGVGRKRVVRATDQDPALARERYAQFKRQVFESLQLLKSRFHFHFIPAEGSIEDVRQRVKKELEYQSAMELGDETLAVVRQIPLASEMTQNGRTSLVKRLDDYTARAPALFVDVVNLIQSDFMRIIAQQALQGKAIVRSVSPLLSKPMALDILLDILCERGYSVVLDYQKPQMPTAYDAKSGKFILTQERLWEFHISWPRPAIRLA